jgi:hypothetical protein
MYVTWAVLVEDTSVGQELHDAPDPAYVGEIALAHLKS